MIFLHNIPNILIGALEQGRVTQILYFLFIIFLLLMYQFFVIHLNDIKSIEQDKILIDFYSLSTNETIKFISTSNEWVYLYTETQIFALEKYKLLKKTMTLKGVKMNSKSRMSQRK